MLYRFRPSSMQIQDMAVRSQVAEAVRVFEEAGLAGMQIEDQESAKKCGHLAGKRLVLVGEMVAKIEAAVRAQRPIGIS